MSTQFEKPLPLVPGCKAIFIYGLNVGKVVTCRARLFPGQSYEVDGVKRTARDHHFDFWHVEADAIKIRIGGKLITSDMCVTPAESLMRIDGGTEAFTCEDAFVYSAKTV